MPIEKVNRDDIIRSLKQGYNELVPGFDVQTEGTPEEDIFVKAPTYGAIGSLWDSLYDISLKQSYEFPENIDEEELDNIFNTNFGFSRRTSIRSTGTATFYALKLSRDITIYDGTTISTPAGIQFQVLGTYVMLASVSSTYYDPAVGLYAITVPIQALVGGADGNIKIGVITDTVSSIDGITSVINNSATAGGEEDETNTQYVERFSTILKEHTGAWVKRRHYNSVRPVNSQLRTTIERNRFNPPEKTIFYLRKLFGCFFQLLC